MNWKQRTKFQNMPLSKLRKLRNDLDVIITKLEKGPRREIDIAADHTGDPALIVQILRVIGDPTSGKWIQVERILCSPARCSECPHGEFMYEYRRSEKGILSVRFGGKGFDQKGLDNLQYYRVSNDGHSLDLLPSENNKGRIGK
ncbi:MAG: hypothetical protein LZF62_380024 [Nitrospira sp.]|nr:MAG: hypothetical protein LZF62_380024 [Nitrospira sp.]